MSVSVIPTIFATSCIAALVRYPSSRCARYNNGMTAERLCSGGYLERICFTSFGYFFSRLIGQYLRAQCQQKQELQPGLPQNVLLRFSAARINYQRKVYANDNDAAWLR